MKKWSLIGVIVLSVLAMNCGAKNDGRSDATSTGPNGWVFEGWSCAPNQTKALQGLSPGQYCPEDGPNDYLYMKFSAAAEQSTIERQDTAAIAMRQSTCRKAAKDQISADGLAKILGEYLEQASGVKNGQSTGQVIIAQNKGLIRGVGVYNCCSLMPSGSCAERGETETWEACQCVGYLKYPGGQKAFEAAAEKASAESAP
jgi:hypothetical protein